MPVPPEATSSPVPTATNPASGRTATGGQRRALARAALIIAPATTLANVLAYAFNIVVSRALGPDGYGALGALLGLVIVGVVPALSLQAVVARRVAVASPGDVNEVVGRLLRAGVLVGTLTMLVVLVVSPAVAAYLRLELAAAWALAASLWPLGLVHAQQGALQGQERFGALATLLVTTAGLRLVAGAVAVAAGGGAAHVLLATAVGAVLAAVVGAVLVRDALPAVWRATRPAGLLNELSRAGLGLLALATLANVDVLLARHHLSPRDAGLYAVGAIFAKAAFWAPQVVVVVVYPRLTRGGSGRVMRLAVASTAIFGLVLVAATALLAHLVVPLVFGPEYADLAPYAWAFTALGASLAVAQLLVFDSIAGQRSRLALVVATAAVVEVTVISIWLHAMLPQIVGVALVNAVGLVVVGSLLAKSARR